MRRLYFKEALREILEKDDRYDPEAYLFLRQALDYTTNKLNRNRTGQHKHVSGQELLNGLRAHALEQFGPLAKIVLENWGIFSCEDIGEIVFNMVEVGILGRTDEDSKDDFRNGFDFVVAFELPYMPPSKQKAFLDSTEAPISVNPSASSTGNERCG
ncbi:MAG TPA: hypothetical protein DEW46_12520 [Verrucomicrobia bacterium]|jgi:uncharacterized repeat protein (TIGR04138 family)|nr:hypothetical protein [Verrucomicrobiota bacterium]